MSKKIILSVFTILFFIQAYGQTPISISLDASTKHDLLSFTENNGVYEIVTQGKDPYVVSNKITETYDPDTTYMVQFDYYSLTGIDNLRIYFNPFSLVNSVDQGALPIAEIWTTCVVNLKRKSNTWNNPKKDFLRFDFGTANGQTIKLKNIKLRKITTKEYTDWKNSSDWANVKLLEYNKKVFQKKIEKVKVDADSITISGINNESIAGYYLSEILMHENAFDKTKFNFSVALPVLNAFEIKIPRFGKSETGATYDRLYSRWMITDINGDAFSHAHWADEISAVAKWNIPEQRPITPKGVAGMSDKSDYWPDLVELGAHSVTYGLILPQIITLTPTALTHTLNGKTYYFNAEIIAKLDAAFKFCSTNDIQVSIILLIGYNMPADLKPIFLHPDAKGGFYSLANVVQERGVEYYTAAVDFLAQRYSRPDNQYGRITNWILHNEMDAAPIWTNAGDKPRDLYLDQYSRSMRTVYYTARKYNPVSKVFISFTKRWKNIHTYCTPDVLRLLCDIGKREGDFEWGIAFHSYPLNYKPDSWNNNVSNDINTAQYITPKNLELIDKWARTRENLYQDCKVRSVILSENGMSHDDYSRAQLDLQAAGVAYFWKKAKDLPAIEALHYHKWVDHATEANLKFGLWSNKEGTVNDFGKKKPSWTLYKYAGSNFEDVAFDSSKEIIGISDWNVIYNNVSPAIQPYTIQFELLNNNVVIEGATLLFNKDYRKTDAEGKCKFLNIASTVGQIEVNVQLTSGGKFVFPIIADANKLVKIDIGANTIDETPMNMVKYIQQEPSYIPFDYSEWFPSNTNDIRLKKKTKLYPNPSNDKVLITYEFDNNDFQRMEIVDLSGKIFKASYKMVKNQIVIDVANFQPGYYLVNVFFRGAIIKERFLKS